MNSNLLADLLAALIIGLMFIFLNTLVHAEERPLPPQPTIADCPAGTILGVEDTSDPQPLMGAAGITPEPGSTPPDITADMMPRRFVTGCIALQPKQNNQGEIR